MFMSTGLSTLLLLRPQKRGCHKGHNRKYMEVEGPYRDLLDHCSQWVELLPYQEDYDFRLSIHSGDIGITV